MRQVDLSVAGDGWNIEALDVARAVLSIAVHHIICRTRVVLLEHLQVQDVLAHEELIGHAHHLHASVAVEDDDIVDVGAVADELVLLQSGADEALLAVDVELLRGLDDLGGLDGVEVSNLGATRMVLTIFLLDEAEPFDRDIDHVVQFVVDVLDFLLDAGDEFVGLVLVELQDALHLDFHESQDVVASDVADELLAERLQPLEQMLDNGIHVGRLLELAVLIHAFLDEDALQRGEEQLFLKFTLANLELTTQE